MKPLVLFVDDDDMVLKSTRLVLHSMRHEWDIMFANSATVALALMEERSVDVLISDLMMPGMNGAQLLEEVMQRYPETIRFLVSGLNDLDSSFNYSSVLHRVFEKPVDMGVIKMAVRAAIQTIRSKPEA